MNPDDVQAAIDLIPETGEMTFDEWKLAAMVSAQQRVVKLFHKLRRQGLVNARLAGEGEDGVLYVSRPVTSGEGE